MEDNWQNTKDKRTNAQTRGVDPDQWRRKREDNLVDLRKSRREELITKKRNMLLGHQVDQNLTQGFDQQLNNEEDTSKYLQGDYLTDVPPLGKDQPKTYQGLHLLPNLVNLINSTCDNDKIRSAIGFRKLLSLENDPPIQAVIDANVVPKLIIFLSRNDLPKLQFEAAWALTNIASGTHQHCNVVVDKGAVVEFVRLLKSETEEVREQSLWALGNIAGDTAKNRDKILYAGGLMPIMELMKLSIKQQVLKNGAWVLSNLCRGKPAPKFEMIRAAIPTLCNVIMTFQDHESLTDCCWAISYLSDGPNDRIQAVVDTGVVPKLIELMQHSVVNIQVPALRTVGNIATGTDSQTEAVIINGSLPLIQQLLSHSKQAIRKEAAWTTSNVAAGTPAQIQKLMEMEFFPKLLKLMIEDAYEVRRESAQCISNAASGGAFNQVNTLVELGACEALTKLLTQKDIKLINIALEATENILKQGLKYPTAEERNPFAIKMDEAGTVDALENLQQHPNQDIYDRVVKIIEDYFGVDEDDNVLELPKPCESMMGQGGFQFSFLNNNPAYNF